MAYVIRLKRGEKFVSINGDLIISAERDGNGIKLGFDGPKDKYAITSMSLLKKKQQDGPK